MAAIALDVFFAIAFDDDHVERLLAEIDEENPLAVEERPNGIRVFFSNEVERGRAAVRLIAVDPSIECVPVQVDDEDWAVRSQKALGPIQVGRLVIVPETESAEAIAGQKALGPIQVGRLVIVPETESAEAIAEPAAAIAGRNFSSAEALTILIRPSMGFGTGHHPSTRLCLSLLQRIDMSGRRVLDVGTGSGVLAIAASLLGASSVIAIDRDEDAIASARENVALNNVGSTVSAQALDLMKMKSPVPFDVVLANLTGAALVRHADTLIEMLSSKASLIVSGVLETEEESVVDRFAAAQLRVQERLREDEWVGLRLSK